MADAAVWIESCAPALGWRQGEFVDLWLEARVEADQLALDSWSVWPVFSRLLNQTVKVEYTAQELLTRLNQIKGKESGRWTDWPLTAEALSSQLRRYLPCLQRQGIRVLFLPRKTNRRPIRIEVLKRPSAG
jgi:putative DNA primase/helicase